MLKFSPAKARLRLKSRPKFWSLFRDELLRTCHKTTTVINMTKVFDKKKQKQNPGKASNGSYCNCELFNAFIKSKSGRSVNTALS